MPAGRLALTPVALLLVGVVESAAQGSRAPVDLARHFERRIDLMIPMRDGVRLHTEVYLPRTPPAGPRPILLERTPYYAQGAMAGYQLMVAGEVVRARFRNSFSAPEPVPPGEVVEYAIHLRDRSHRFGRGHRIMVQVQSTWFPLIDRNPQTWVPNIFHAAPADFRKATHHVYVSPRYPTHIALPVRQVPALGRTP